MRPRQSLVGTRSASIIQRAARSAPTELAERLEEEWLADLATRRSGFARLRLALGCCWASRVIAHDFLAAGVAPRATSSHTAVVTLGSQGFSPFSRRTMIFVLIVGMHVALIYAFASGFAINVIKHAPTVFTGTAIDFVRRKPPDEPKPPADSSLARHGPILPALSFADVSFEPTIIVQQEKEGEGVVIREGRSDPPPLKRVLGGPGAGFPNTDDYYPPSAIRLREQGATAIQVCVNESGKLQADPTIVQSSGFSLLDEGALKLAKAGSGHYRTTTENGRPVSDCYSFRVRFRFKQ
jgi:TonB family protein